MIFRKRKPAPAVADALKASLETGGYRVDEFVEAILRVDETGDAKEIEAAFATITATPGLVATIDHHCRPGYWDSVHYPRILHEAADRLKAGKAGPLATTIAGSHGDGRVRALAITKMLENPLPAQLPFLLLRMTDWAAPVRDRARAGIAALLHDQPTMFVPAAAETILYLGMRWRGDFGVRQLHAAAYDAPSKVLDRLSESENVSVQRFAFEVQRRRGELKVDGLVRRAEKSRDVWIRARASEAAAREAVWTGQIDVLRRLASNRHGEVRISAFTGLARLGHLGEIAALLDDRASLVRALARDAARRTEVDALAWYREAVTAETPSLGAIAGLAESGRAGDGPLLHPLLTHPVPRIRAYAVGALRILGAVPRELVTPMLEDPSPKVARAAAKALGT